MDISDDGVGMSENAETQKASLGTSIIQALARQLRANVRIAAESPG